jgi:AraC-like DNA-binding protein
VDVERNIVVPDVIVTRIGRAAQPKFRVQLNSDVMPRLRVHDIYAGALKAHKGEGHQALQQRLQEARWFIKNIQQRFDTILRVSNAIVERQKNFFVHGELAMRPLVLREIADELGLHESTISRVTTAKYMATPYGTFELKYFFGSALGTEAGGNASSTAVRALIKQFVAQRKPHQEAAVATTRYPTCSRSRALNARAAPWPSTARRCASRRPTCARRSVNALQSSFACLASAWRGACKDLLSGTTRCTALNQLQALQGDEVHGWAAVACCCAAPGETHCN